MLYHKGMYQCRLVFEFSWYLASGTLRLVYSGLVFQTFTRVFRKKIDNELKMSFLSWEFKRISKVYQVYAICYLNIWCKFNLWSLSNSGHLTFLLINSLIAIRVVIVLFWQYANDLSKKWKSKVAQKIWFPRENS